MAILLDRSSRLLIQGITGATGRDFAARMVGAGTALVGGVTPGRGGGDVLGLPVFGTVAEAVAAVQPNASLVCVPAPFTEAAVWEAAAAGIGLISVYTEHVPLRDAARLIALARSYGARVIGPNAAGVVPGQANGSDLNDANLRPGSVGIVSKSGTLTYEVIDGIQHAGLGESTVACIGGDRLIGTQYSEVLELFAADADTACVVMLGEIGGDAELQAARRWQALGAPKPLVSYIAGQAAPAGKRFGHAGAIVGGDWETATAKTRALDALGVVTARQVSEVAGLVVSAIGRAR